MHLPPSVCLTHFWENSPNLRLRRRDTHTHTNKYTPAHLSKNNNHLCKYINVPQFSFHIIEFRKHWCDADYPYMLEEMQ